jgi:hypothetical protein
MTMPSWIDSEPGPLATLRQAARMLRGGFQRPVVTVATTLLLVAALVGKLAWTQPAYAPRFVLRVVEMGDNPLSSPRPTQELAATIREVIWTDDALLDLVQRHQLYPGLRQDPRAALDAFRRDIEVNVSDNYFVQERSATDPPRSARIVVRFRSIEPDLAITVTRALGTLIVDRELASRADRAVRTHAHIDQELGRARHRQLELRAQIATKQREMAALPLGSPRLGVELVSALGALDGQEKQTLALERREALVSLGAAAETEGLGLRFTVVDDGAIPRSAGRGPGRLAAVALLASMLALPLVALGVGAGSASRRPARVSRGRRAQEACIG